MPAYIVTLPDVGGGRTSNGTNAVAVFAETTADAIAMAKTISKSDSNGLWAQATATAIAAKS